MAYYIFLKSLWSLEEFRKNPHVKIHSKSPCANFQSLGKFKNPIFNLEILFPCFRPGRPCGPLGHWPRWPLSSRGLNSTLPPPSRFSVKWARAVRFVFLPRRPTVATSSRRLWPPRAARPPTLRCQARSSLHALIPPP
jgi:hypothetical protein